MIAALGPCGQAAMPEGNCRLNLGLRLGEAVNILDGLTPGWHGRGKSTRVFAALPYAPLVTFPLDQPPALGAWEPPRVTLHDNLDALADALFDYRVIASRSDQGQRPLPPSTLMLGGVPTLSVAGAIGDLLGIDLARPDIGGFVLLEVRRNDADLRHDVERGGVGLRIRIDRYWTRLGRHAMARLRWTWESADADRKRNAFVTARQALRYLDYFYDYGTHFVARVGLGQRLFQVLACRADRYRFLADFWRREAGAAPAAGPLAVSFIPFTGPDWMCARGAVTSVGDEPELVRFAQAGSWRTDEPESADILLTPFAKSPRAAAALLARLQGSAATRVELMSQGYLMGEARVQAWQQVLNGALLQRYGVSASQVPQIAGRTSSPLPPRSGNWGSIRIVTGTRRVRTTRLRTSNWPKDCGRRKKGSRRTRTRPDSAQSWTARPGQPLPYRLTQCFGCMLVIGGSPACWRKPAGLCHRKPERDRANPARTPARASA
jgi:hypothetical protein